MLIDHIGFALLPNVSWLRVIGRLAFPLFAFQISIGFDKTKNKEKYIFRMLLFTIFSQIPFAILRKITLSSYMPMLNIGATLTCGLLMLYCFEKIKQPLLKYSSMLAILLISIIVPMDYAWYGVLLIFIFYLFRKDKIGTAIFYFVLLSSYCYYRNSTFNLPSIFALLPLFLYNGKKGKDVKYFFYAFYPLHMLIIICIKLLMLQ